MGLWLQGRNVPLHLPARLPGLLTGSQETDALVFTNELCDLGNIMDLGMHTGAMRACALEQRLSNWSGHSSP